MATGANYREKQQLSEETAAIGKFAVVVILASAGIAALGVYADRKKSEQLALVDNEGEP